MSQRLYRVRVERINEVVVIASGQVEAEFIAYDAIRDDDGGLGVETRIAEATHLTCAAQLPSKWDQGCLPYGSDEKGDRTIAAILSTIESVALVSK